MAIKMGSAWLSRLAELPYTHQEFRLMANVGTHSVIAAALVCALATIAAFAACCTVQTGAEAQPLLIVETAS